MTRSSAILLLSTTLLGPLITVAPALAQDTATIYGTVTDETGKPVGGIRVKASRGPHERTTTTDPKGRYSLRVPTSMSPVIVSFFGSRSGWIDEYFDDVPLWTDAKELALQAGDSIRADASIARMATITGVVTNEQGVYLSDIIVLGEAPRGGGPSIITRTEPDGSYRLWIPPDRTQVVVHFLQHLDHGVANYDDEWSNNTQDRSAAQVLKIEPGSLTEGIDASLPRRATVWGKVRNEEGRPLEGVEVMADPHRSPGPYDYEVTGYTSADGSYELMVPAAVGPVRMRFTPPTSSGYRGEFYENARRTWEATDFDLHSGERVEINAVLGKTDEEDQPDDTGIVYGTVTDEQGNRLDGIRVFVEDQHWGGWEMGETDLKGEYSIRVPTKFNPFTVEFYGENLGWNPEYYNDATTREAAEKLTIQLDESMKIDAVLTRAATITGRVTDETGKPLADISVHASPSHQNKSVAKTGADGRYVLYSDSKFGQVAVVFRQGSSDAVFDDEWYDDARTKTEARELKVEPGVLIEGIDAALPRRATIYGRVTNEKGEPLSPATVAVELEGSYPDYQLRTETGADGRYELVVPTTYGQAKVRFAASKHFYEYYNDARWDETPEWLTLEPNERIEVNAALERKFFYIDRFKSGYICARDEKTHTYSSTEIGIDGEGEICPSVEIPVRGEGRCVFNGEETNCTWYGFTFDFDGNESEEPLVCTWTRSWPANEGDSKEIRQAKATSGTFEIDIGDHYHGRYVHRMYHVFAPVDFPWLVVNMDIDCARNDEKLFTAKYEFIFSSVFK